MTFATLITNSGKQIIMDRTFNSSPTLSEPSLFQVGTGIAAPTASDTNLETPLGSPAALLSGYPIIDESLNKVTLRAFIDTATDNGENLAEFGIFNTDGPKLLFSRVIYTIIAKSAQIEIVYSEKEIF